MSRPAAADRCQGDPDQRGDREQAERDPDPHQRRPEVDRPRLEAGDPEHVRDHEQYILMSKALAPFS